MTFDLERYQYQSRQLDLSGLDWDAVRETPLSPKAISTLYYMMDIEGHTSIYLSELLVSKASLEPEITGFLHVWAYEEMFHSLALRRFLREYGEVIPDDRARGVRTGEGLGRVKTTLAILLGSYVFDFFPAFYLTLGGINELTTLWGYQQLVERTGHPVLEQLLRRIVKQERRHYAYYRHQAERELLRSSRHQRRTRWMLDHSFGAVGEGVKTEQEIDELVLYLFGDAAGRRVARRIDGEIARLPGMEGAYLVEKTLDRAERRQRVASTRDLVRESADDMRSANDALTGGHLHQADERGEELAS